jgi:hypothetical protein
MKLTYSFTVINDKIHGINFLVYIFSLLTMSHGQENIAERNIINIKLDFI